MDFPARPHPPPGSEAAQRQSGCGEGLWISQNQGVSHEVCGETPRSRWVDVTNCEASKKVNNILFISIFYIYLIIFMYIYIYKMYKLQNLGWM